MTPAVALITALAYGAAFTDTTPLDEFPSDAPLMSPVSTGTLCVFVDDETDTCKMYAVNGGFYVNGEGYKKLAIVTADMQRAVITCETSTEAKDEEVERLAQELADSKYQYNLGALVITAAVTFLGGVAVGFLIHDRVKP